MKKKKLGKQGPEISVVGYGAWEAGGEHYGPNPSEEEVIEAIHTGLDAGMDWIDTAEVYGMGESERLVGNALQGRRDDVFVATKVAPKPQGSGFAPDQILQGCRQSLERLQTDRIDLYQLHWPDASGNVSIDETWEAMGGLVKEGLVRYIGVSNFPKPMIETLLSIRHVDSLQPEFSLLLPDLRDVIDWCGTKGIGVVPYGPLAYGMLTGAITADTEFHEKDWRGGKRPDVSDNRLFQPEKRVRALAVVDGLRPIADRLGITLSQLALAWVFHQKGVTSAIAGSRNPEHVRENAAAGDVELDEKTLLEIEDLIPLGPEFSG
jgi:aryl-alcohol dehydrogenase-like predicted oxidoreductase